MESALKKIPDKEIQPRSTGPGERSNNTNPHTYDFLTLTRKSSHLRENPHIYLFFFGFLFFVCFLFFIFYFLWGQRMKYKGHRLPRALPRDLYLVDQSVALERHRTRCMYQHASHCKWPLPQSRERSFMFSKTLCIIMRWSPLFSWFFSFSKSQYRHSHKNGRQRHRALRCRPRLFQAHAKKIVSNVNEISYLMSFSKYLGLCIASGVWAACVFVCVERGCCVFVLSVRM